MHVNLYTDGGSRNNPGPSALGCVIKNDEGTVLAAFGEYLGEQTNNYAEYSAVIAGLLKAKELGATSVTVLADSKLAVEQLSGNWKVKHPVIQQLFVKAYNAAQQFEKVDFKHIYREDNTEADAQVNIAIDKELDQT